MLGYSPKTEAIDDEFLLRMLHPDDRERFLAEDKRTDETGEPFKVEYRQFAKDGRMVWVRDEAVLVRDEEGSPLYWLGVQYDITEQKRVEEALKESDELYRTVVEQAAENILLVDVRTKRILEANAALRR
jgi:PAS domain S-box-containing protein